MNDQFGGSVRIGDDTVVVGAPDRNLRTGAVYIFGRNQGGADNWGLVKILTAIDGAGGDNFGLSVGIEDGTIAIGADQKNSLLGAAYIFERNQGGADNWGQVQKLTSGNGTEPDRFGTSVGISSGTILIGSPGKNSRIGAAYVFTNQCGQWAQVQKPIASVGFTLSSFSFSVGISGDTIVVGAPENPHLSAGAAYIFERNQGGADNWGQVKILTASDRRDSGRFGWSVGISGDTVVAGGIGGNPTGAAYIFERNQGGPNNWGEVKILTASDVAVGDGFGSSVAINGGRIVAGAAGKNSKTGAAYIFERNQGGPDNWGQVKILTASDGAANDFFGNSLEISADTVVVGASGKNSNTGAAYIFDRNQGGANNWGQVRKLTASDGAPTDLFGASVGISGDTVVAGAYGKNTRTGAAYIFKRNQGGTDNWGQVKKLTASNAAAEDKFGYSVGISGSRVVVGESGKNSGIGVAYIFGSNQGGTDNWGQIQVLTASDGVIGDAFGLSVGISGDTVLVGAYGKNAQTGASYIFATVCPPTISKAFGGCQCPAQRDHQLEFHDHQSDASHAISGLAFTDALPAGLIVATPANVTGSCGGAVAAVAGSGTISLSGGSLAAGGACTISVNVTATTIGPKINTTSPLMTSIGPAAPSNTAVLNVHDLRASVGDPLICTGSGGLVSVTATVTNGAATSQAASFTANLPANLLAVPGTCTASVGTCAVVNASTVTWMDTLAAGQTVTINYQAQIADGVTPGSQVCITSSATVGGAPAGSVTACTTPNCPPSGPGLPLAAVSPMSDQKVGSVLIYNVYTSSIDPMRQNTRLSITNTEPTRPAFVHLFFVDGASCSVADSFLCLTPNQTATFLASDLDPGITGYAVAVATDATGCPINFNYLIGDEYVKFQSGHAANLGAEAISAIAGGLPVCDTNSSTAALAFDGVSYNAIPHVLAADNLPSRADGNDTMLIVNRIGGNLGTGAGTLGTLFGLFYDDQEIGASFQFTPGACQFRSSISNAFPRIAPRFEQFVPAGRSGWFKLWEPGLFGISGALINFNANATASAGAFNQGHNLHTLTSTNTASYVIPVFPPNC